MSMPTFPEPETCSGILFGHICHVICAQSFLLMVSLSHSFAATLPSVLWTSFPLVGAVSFQSLPILRVFNKPTYRSTVFLNFHWLGPLSPYVKSKPHPSLRFMDKTGQTGSMLQLVNGIVLLSTFFGVRLAYGGKMASSNIPHAVIALTRPHSRMTFFTPCTMSEMKYLLHTLLCMGQVIFCCSPSTGFGRSRSLT